MPCGRSNVTLTAKRVARESLSLAVAAIVFLLAVIGYASSQSSNGLQITGPTPWIDVKAFGATGNGSTDDTTSIQNAINTCPTSPNGCTVFFPSGSYKISSALTVAQTVPGVKIIGQCSVIGVSSSCSQIITGSAIYMVQVGDTTLAHSMNGFEVRNMQFSDFSGSGTVKGAIQLNAVNDFRIDSVFCNNFKGSGSTTTGSCLFLLGGSGAGAAVTQYGTITSLATTNTKFPVQTKGKTSSINFFGGDIECNLATAGSNSIGFDVGFNNPNTGGDNDGGEWGVFGTHILNCDTGIYLNSMAAFLDFAAIEQTNTYVGTGTGMVVNAISGTVGHTAGTIVSGSMSELLNGVVINASVDPVTVSTTFNVVTNPLPLTNDSTAQGKAVILSPGQDLQVPTDLIFTGVSAPSVSVSSAGKEYFDKTANVFKESRNGGAYGFRGFASKHGPDGRPHRAGLERNRGSR
jgi:hypothetical protein